MKLATLTIDGHRTYGAVKDNGFVVLDSRLQSYPDLLSIIVGNGLDAARAYVEKSSPDVSLDAVLWEPVLPNPPKILCVGVNYRSHADESGFKAVPHPFIFPRYAASQVGHLQPMVCPRESDKFDYEGELVAIIGKGGRRISKDAALSHIVGYSIYNEGSVRDWQTHSTQWTPGKNFVSTGAFGPWMVTADEIPDPYKLELTTRLNGQIMQNASIDLMMFRLEELISYISTFIPLEPGDVIVSGTPGGVGHGRKPPIYMNDGDLVEVEITGIGKLRNPVAKEGAEPRSVQKAAQLSLVAN
jgi:2-keto-4-pentenoate hydratase/2-oxohepta-3-ene-1,7-dioic acid hydratase in catechol pathway